jgi:hypothetical protein
MIFQSQLASCGQQAMIFVLRGNNFGLLSLLSPSSGCKYGIVLDLDNADILLQSYTQHTARWQRGISLAIPVNTYPCHSDLLF